LYLSQPVAIKGLAWAAPLRREEDNVVTFWPLDFKPPVIAYHHGHGE
jgi:hypothetical protein